MGIVIGIIVGTLVVAAQVYFLCGGRECDRNDKEDSKSGCLLALIIGFICSLIYFGFNS